MNKILYIKIEMCSSADIFTPARIGDLMRLEGCGPNSAVNSSWECKPLAHLDMRSNQEHTGRPAAFPLLRSLLFCVNVVRLELSLLKRTCQKKIICIFTVKTC